MPHFANAHTRCLTTGLAMYNRQCFYASGAGPAGACKSIWASLVGNKSSCFVQELHGNLTFNFGGIKGTHTQYQSLPNCVYKHFVILAPPSNTIMLFDPKCAALDNNLTAAQRTSRMPEVYEQFYIYLKSNIDIPVQKEWVSEIWHSAREADYGSISPMQTYGDCIAAWVIKPNWTWIEHISSLVRIGRLRIKTGEQP